MTKSNPTTIRLSAQAEDAVNKILKAHTYLSNRTDAIEFALAETAKRINKDEIQAEILYNRLRALKQ